MLIEDHLLVSGSLSSLVQGNSLLFWPWVVSSKHILFSPQLNAYRGPSSGLWISLFPSPGLSSVNSSCLPLQHSASATQLQEPTRLHLSYSLPAVARNLPCASFGLGLISLLSFFSKTIVFVGWCPVSSILLFHIFCLPPPFFLVVLHGRVSQVPVTRYWPEVGIWHVLSF